MSARLGDLPFTHVVTCKDGMRHSVVADGRNHAGFRPEAVVAIRPLQQPDGSWPSLTKRDTA